MLNFDVGTADGAASVGDARLKQLQTTMRVGYDTFRVARAARLTRDQVTHGQAAKFAEKVLKRMQKSNQK